MLRQFEKLFEELHLEPTKVFSVAECAPLDGTQSCVFTDLGMMGIAGTRRKLPSPLVSSNLDTG